MKLGLSSIVEMIQKGETRAPELGAIVPAFLTLGCVGPARVGMAQLVLISSSDEINNIGHVRVLRLLEYRASLRVHILAPECLVRLFEMLQEFEIARGNFLLISACLDRLKRLLG